jgi:hypothetical protein
MFINYPYYESYHEYEFVTKLNVTNRYLHITFIFSELEPLSLETRATDMQMHSMHRAVVFNDLHFFEILTTLKQTSPL